MDSIMSFLNACPGAVSQGIIWGIMGVGVFITFKVLDYADLTVDSSLCTGGAVSAMLIGMGMHPVLTLVFATLAGMAAGAVTGLLHTKLEIPAILSGILTQLALYSINLRIMGRANVSLLGQPTMITLLDIPQAILVGGLVAVVMIAVLYWFFGTEIGCAVRATGDNGNMARAMGVNTDTMKVLGLTISNGMVGLAGALLAQYQGYADVQSGRGAIVIGLASVIIGEVLIGRRANFAVRMGSIIVGSIVYYVIISFVLQLGLNTSDLKLFSALVVAIALAIPSLRQKLALRQKLSLRGGAAGKGR
ncbi:MAG TPA: ABC transporter permease [Candidatus Aphodomorpha intestinavium]|uniref:ABC transporter permease n=1 Tax=Candidatus Aphodomorpha intestinavium TaxID=2840672 RepID=A0A9D1N2L2_9FIRM|nr:ABC transporter permease [Candidatus Aphodomorpha intestinavium]